MTHPIMAKKKTTEKTSARLALRRSLKGNKKTPRISTIQIQNTTTKNIQPLVSKKLVILLARFLFS